MILCLLGTSCSNDNEPGIIDGAGVTAKNLFKCTEGNATAKCDECSSFSVPKEGGTYRFELNENHKVSSTTTGKPYQIKVLDFTLTRAEELFPKCEHPENWHPGDEVMVDANILADNTHIQSQITTSSFVYTSYQNYAIIEIAPNNTSHIRILHFFIYGGLDPNFFPSILIFQEG